MTGGTKHKHSYLGRLAQDSLILSALNALQAKLGRALRRVPVRRPRSGAEGVFGALRRRAAVAKRTAVLKMKVASAVESSAAVRVYRGFVRTLLGLSMQTVAVFFITFGLYTLASSLIRLFTAGQPASPSELLPGVLSLLFAALFVGCGDSLQSKLRGSGLFRLVFVRLLGVDEQTLAGTASVRGYGAVAVIVGTLLGSLSYFVSAWRILLCLLSVLFALAVLRFPETGLLAALLLFPFLPAPGLAALLVVSFASYLLRLSRGKRNFRFAKPDGCFWFFAAASLLLLGGDTGASAALRLCCACAFPLCVNLLRSEKLLSRAAACLFVGLSAFAVLFCLTAWTPARAVWDALGLPVFAPTAAAAAVCLTALLPLCVQALLRAPARGRRLAALLQLQPAAAGPDLRGGGEEDLDVGPRQHHGPDVAAVHDHIVLPGQAPLLLHQECPHLRDGGDGGSKGGDLMPADLRRHVLPVEIHVLQAVRSVFHRDIQGLQQGDHRLGVRGVHPCPKGLQAHGAVDGPGVHVQKPQRLRQGLGQGRLPGPGGAVDGDTSMSQVSSSSPSARSAAASPAARPVDQAICRLKPPV